MKEKLTQIQRMAELFTERLSVVMLNDDEFLMEKLVEVFEIKKLDMEDFAKTLNDFAACLTVPDEV